MILLFSALASAGETWHQPPAEILDVLAAPEAPSVWVNPTADTLLLVTAVRYPPLAERAAAMVRVAGLRIDPRTHSHFGVTGYEDPRLVRVSDGRETALPLPEGARVLGAVWTADGERMALSVRTADHVGVWVGDTEGRLTEMVGLALDPLLGSEIAWLPDQERLLVKRIDPARGAPPSSPAVPDGPDARSTSGGTASSTYEARDLIVTSHDEALFTHYATSSIGVVDPRTGAFTAVGKPDVYADVTASPDGEHLLVERLAAPWSHMTAWYRFGREIEVWTLDGAREATIASLRTDEAVPSYGVPEGPRAMEWRQDAKATLAWVEALDGGDPGRVVAARDRVMTLAAPFTGEATELFRAQHRVQGLRWGKGGLLAIEQRERERRWRHVWTMDADLGPGSAKLLFDLSENDRYADPGDLRMRTQPNGAWLIDQVGDDVFFSGVGGSPTGDRPFVDQRSLKTGRVTRLFRSGADVYEQPLAVVDAKAGALLVMRQSQTEVPNVHLVSRGAKVKAAAGEAVYARVERPLTAFVDPTPAVRAVTKRLVTFARADGTPLSFTLYLPPGYVEGTRLPTVLYAYPREFSDPGTAGQVSGSERTFDRFIGPSHLFFALHGYAVLHNTTMPVVGDADTAYDRFVEELAANAEAAIGEAVRIGVTDPDRVGAMGHSHGALMTATLLAHTDLFRAGIARSGAYNHTIRPFGFQSERRTLWEARETYLGLSPVMFAPQIDEPLLLVHGAIDENPGTVPLQSERLYEAIRGTGGTARLVMLPYEGHGYQAKESVEHVLWEQLTWFDTHVRDAKPR